MITNPRLNGSNQKFLNVLVRNVGVRFEYTQITHVIGISFAADPNTKMATGKMSFNYYQNGKYGLLPHNPQKDMEVTQDMHLKMSKKIAQLTKVSHFIFQS